MIAVLLLPGHELRAAVGRTAGPDQLRRALVGDCTPDVVVLDVGDEDPVALVRVLRGALGRTRLLVVGPGDEGPVGAACVRAGADGVVSHAAVRDGLLLALQRLDRGEAVLGAGTSREVLRSVRSSSTSDGVERLSPAQERILELMASGATNRAIARRLGLAEKTVKNYATSIYRALGVHGRAEAVGAWRDSSRPRAMA